jgi:hypothetical protein
MRQALWESHIGWRWIYGKQITGYFPTGGVTGRQGPAESEYAEARPRADRCGIGRNAAQEEEVVVPGALRSWPPLQGGGLIVARGWLTRSSVVEHHLDMVVVGGSIPPLEHNLAKVAW